MREIRTSGSEGGGVETNRCSLPLSLRDGAGIGPGSTLVRSMAKKPGVLLHCYRFAGILEVSKWLH